MTTATITSKGQITIPISIREDLNLETGDKLVFFSDAKEKKFEAIKSRSILDLEGLLKDIPGPTITDWGKVRGEFEKAMAKDALKYLH